MLEFVTNSLSNLTYHRAQPEESRSEQIRKRPGIFTYYQKSDLAEARPLLSHYPLAPLVLRHHDSQQWIL
jgi:hypothetical protein